MRNMFFHAWATPFEQSALLYERLGRGEEARDTARLALRQPWWTVSTDLARCARVGVQAVGREELGLPGLWKARKGATQSEQPVTTQALAALHPQPSTPTLYQDSGASAADGQRAGDRRPV